MASSYKQGDVILSSQSLVHVLSSTEQGSRCDECFRKSDNLLRCSSCKFIRYCSRSCQANAWPLHKYECPCVKRVAPDLPGDSVRLMYRLLVQLQWYDGKKRTEQVFNKKRGFSELKSHANEIKEDVKRCKDLLQLSQFVSAYGGDNLQLPSSTEFLEIFGKMVINSVSVCDEEMRPIGVGLYLGVSILEHSCKPNAVVVFTGSTAQVRCIEAFSNSAEETNARISYIDTLQSTEDRRHALSEQYYFICDCVCCKDSERDKLMAATHCPKTDCSGLVLQTATGLACDTCTHHPDDSYSTTRQLAAQRATNLISTIRDLAKTPRQSNSVLTKCEQGLNDTMLPDVSNVQLAEMAFDACIELSQWQRVVVYGRQVLDGYIRYHQCYHPLHAVHRMKLAKTLLYLSKPEQAKTLLLEAREVILVTHGEQHDLYEQLANLMAQVVAELNN